ncbi:MAG: family 78 glycoside hydrolase catalytic domain, partial [Muribaculaceae bacterium]|nr:family 78 glycoside hydrolase catalytic domain [Muribaculaceae bacterium]
YLRKEFRLKDKPLKRATAYMSGLGLYRLFINGEEIAPDELLKPVPSDYRRTVYYNTFDVTGQLDTLTAVGIIIGNGRYFPMRADKPHKIPYFGLPTCRLNIIAEYADGTRQRIATDESWKVTDRGPIRSNNEYDGETYDARMEFDGWTRPGFDDSSWKKAERSAVPYGTLRGQATPNMRPDTLGHPVVSSRVSGKLILDFGENMAGHAAFRPKGNAGDTIRIRYAEKLNPDGTLFTANLRDALSTDTYICSGNEDGGLWSPSFTYHGFRYAEVSGMPDAGPEAFIAVHVGDPVARVGSFECSDTLLNRIIANAARGIRANYKGMPVDCPQRNERQPWLGDRTAGALGETYLFDNAALYSKWVRDICEAQRSDGCIPDVAPAFWNYYTDNVTWPAALPFVCDMLLTRYNDPEPARSAYPHIARWMEHILDEHSRGGIVGRDRYGDWCVPPERLDLIHSEDPARKTDGALIATAYTAECLRLLGKFASLLGLDDDAERWAALRKESADAFNRRFLTCRRGTSPVPGHTLYPDSVFYGNNTATANILPLAFGIVPDSLRSEVAKNVVAGIITRDNGHVPCGVIGISWLLRALSDNGFGEVAWLLATNSTYPSWGYMAENGATTIWELWNGDKAKPWMNSGNHVMLLGDLLTWCFTELSGVRPGNAPDHFILRPDFSIPDCEWAKAEVPTPYGPVTSSWEKTRTRAEWDITLPPNTTATVILPDGTEKEIGSGHRRFSADIPSAPGITADEFLYTSASFPQCHAATIAETGNGDLVAAYFGGTHERHPDVCILCLIHI